MTVDIAFDTYHTYDAMTKHLQSLAKAYPKLCTVTSIAKTFRGRDVWFVTITNPDTGPALEKPGFYIDAQIHAEEHATSATALYACWYLLTNYGKDEEVTRLVDQQTFYIIPRINPDGAEYALTAPYHPWCGNGRFLPGEDRIDGLIPQDINGDGYIVQMRVPDTKGEWKKDAQDPRILIQREPGEEGGEYFRLYPEGLIENFDGVHVQIDPQDDGNMNRNFPINWSPREYGAGAYPFSEPEAAGMGQVILNHPNIAGMCAYHTHGGIILRPSMMKMDVDMSPRDLALYKDLGAVGQRLTGYPTISTYEDFTPDKSKARHGSLKDWVYEEKGIICFSTELWDMERTAGVPKVGYYNLGPRDTETTRTVFNWVLENVGDKGFRDWEAFDHPQLGPVEVGGMVYIWSYRNPPGKLLEEVCHNNVMFNLRHAAAAPRVLVDSVTIEALGGDLHKVTGIVSNHGYLPTNLSDVAVQNGVAKPVTITLDCDGAELAMNPSTVELGNLAGRNERKYAYSNWGQQWSPVTKKVEWLVRATKPGATLTVTVASEKGRHAPPYRGGLTLSDTGITLHSPPGVFPVANYHHASVAGGFIHLAGQVARDEQGNWVGGDDPGAQAVQIYRNIGHILSGVGAGPEHVVKIMVYMTGRDGWEGVHTARRDFFGDHRPPHTGLIVAGLGGPQVKIEVEVTAYLPPRG